MGMGMGMRVIQGTVSSSLRSGEEVGAGADRQGTGLSIRGTLGQEETDMGPAREAGHDRVLGSSLTASERPGAGCGRGAAHDHSQEGPGPRSKLPTRPVPRWTLQGLLVSSANEGNV